MISAEEAQNLVQDRLKKTAKTVQKLTDQVLDHLDHCVKQRSAVFHTSVEFGRHTIQNIIKAQHDEFLPRVKSGVLHTLRELGYKVKDTGPETWTICWSDPYDY